MRISVVVVSVFVTGCLPRPQPVQPVAPAPVVTVDASATVAPAAQAAPVAPAPVEAPAPLPPPQPISPYPQQPYPQVAQPLPAPRPLAAPVTIERSHFHDGEVIVDFASVGILASIDLLVRQDVNNGSAGTLIVGAGAAGGAGLGWLLTQHYNVDAGAAHATTIGLSVGIANGARLIEPTKWDNADQVLALLFGGSAIGVAGGFAYGQVAHLTSGQTTFVANMTLLGTATAAFGAIMGSRDGNYGGFENGALALGLDGGVVAGAAIAPSLDWSPRRAKVVFASTAVGALVGGMVAGLTTKPNSTGGSTEYNGDIVAACMTAGRWGGFGLGIMMTRDNPPDPIYAHPTPTGVAAGTGTPTMITPWFGKDGQLGVMTGGTF